MGEDAEVVVNLCKLNVHCFLNYNYNYEANCVFLKLNIIPLY